MKLIAKFKPKNLKATIFLFFMYIKLAKKKELDYELNKIIIKDKQQGVNM